MRWLLVTQDFDIAGGIASWCDDLASALHSEGEDVSVLARLHTEPRHPFPVHRMRGRSWATWQGLWAAAQAAPRLGPDLVVVAATWRLATLLAPLVRATGARLLIGFHGSDLTRLPQAEPGLLRAARAATALLPTSVFLARELHRLGVEAPTRVLPWPLVIPPHPPTRTGTGLLCVARDTPLKGVDRARALARALDRPFTLVQDRPRAEVLDLYARHAAIVLLPRPDGDGSGAEGFGLVLLEAAARGVPAIGCRTGGVPDALGPGLVLDDPDAPDLAAVRAFLADPTTGSQARAWVAGEHNPERTLAVLREVLA